MNKVKGTNDFDDRMVYIFHVKVGELFIPVTDAERLLKYKRKIDVIEHQIFQPKPDVKSTSFYKKPLISFLKTLSSYLDLKVKWELKEATLYMTAETFNHIKGLLQTYKLDVHADVLFFLIANIENYACGNSYGKLSRDYSSATINQFTSEIRSLKAAIRAIRALDDKKPNTSEAKVVSVIFKLNRGGSIKITDSFLQSTIGDALIQYFKNSNLNWEESVDKLLPLWTDRELIHRYLPKALVKALHGFFFDIDAFPYKEKQILDREIYAIAEILQTSHIVFKSEDENLDASEGYGRQLIKQRIKSLISNP